MSETFRKELESLINRHSAENGSDTPDFILADYLQDCLFAWDKAVAAREKWYGRPLQDRDKTAEKLALEAFNATTN
jgi:hypothetical protein